METIVRSFTVAACLLVAPASAYAQANSTGAPTGVEAAAWLAGCWEASSEDGQNAAEEQWMAPRGGLMVGMSRSIRDGRATGFELATIGIGSDGVLTYHAMPSGQSPADFPARSIEDGRLEFVNADHDFPQKIVYARLDDNFVHAAVFGEADGAQPAFLVPYRRVDCPE
jgi:hypothetical protein